MTIEYNIYNIHLSISASTKFQLQSVDQRKFSGTDFANEPIEDFKDQPSYRAIIAIGYPLCAKKESDKTVHGSSSLPIVPRENLFPRTKFLRQENAQGYGFLCAHA